jgi:hypothetical protein
MSKSPTGDFEWEKGRANAQRRSLCIILPASPARFCEGRAARTNVRAPAFAESRHEAKPHGLDRKGAKAG